MRYLSTFVTDCPELFSLYRDVLGDTCNTFFKKIRKMSKINSKASFLSPTESYLLEKFLCGILTGVILFFLMLQGFQLVGNRHKVRSLSTEFFQRMSERIDFLSSGTDQDIRLQDGPEVIPDLEIDFGFHHDSLTEEGLALKKNITISCYIITRVCSKGGIAVNRTWGKRCNHIRYLIPEGYKHCDLPTVRLPDTTDFSVFCSNALTAIQKNFINESDWTLVATDNNYVIIENVRSMLKIQTPEEPILYSYYEESKSRGAYPNAIYLFSKSALTSYDQISGTRRCDAKSKVSADLYTVLCMQDLDIKLEQNGSHAFNAAPVELSFYSKPQNLSHNIASFRMVTPRKMLAFEYFVYHLRPYGLS